MPCAARFLSVGGWWGIDCHVWGPTTGHGSGDAPTTTAARAILYGNATPRHARECGGGSTSSLFIGGGEARGGLVRVRCGKVRRGEAR